MSGLDWLTAHPIAHRGLHDAAGGIIENTPSAFAAAIAGHYAIECDLQVTADDEAMVYHDDTLGRLTEGGSRLDAMTAADLKRVRYKATTDRMITLAELCELVSGRATLIIELKSRFDGDARLVRRAAQVLSAYPGAAVLMSFDPAQIAKLRAFAPKLPGGIVAQSLHRHHERSPLSAARALACLPQALRARPQFIAYSVSDLPATIPLLARTVLGLPLLAWTVRTDAQRKRAAQWADQMIFEGFRP